MNNQLPAGYWPDNAPAYLTPEGWAFEKQLVKARIAKSLEAIAKSKELIGQSKALINKK